MKNRNMFYTNNQAGGFFNPNPNMNYNMPSGFNQNSNYMAYGPNVGANGVIPTDQNMIYNAYDESTIDTRLTKLERAVRKLETRVTKIESNQDILIEDDTSNLYMI